MFALEVICSYCLPPDLWVCFLAASSGALVFTVLNTLTYSQLPRPLPQVPDATAASARGCEHPARRVDRL